MITLEELITKYTLDDEGYKEGANKVLETTEKVGEKIEGIKDRIKDAFSGVFRTIANPLSLMLGGAGLVDIIHHTTELAMNWDYLERSMVAVTGSAQNAKDALSFVEKLAIPSIFTKDDLAEAAMRLEAFGLRTQTYLPVVEKLGTVFGGTSDKLMEFVDAMGMLRGGQTGRAFRTFEEAGLSREDFVKVGLKFDKQGELVSDINSALDAVGQVVQERFGSLTETVGNSFKSKWASFENTLENIYESIGGAILKLVMPAINAVTAALDTLVSHDYFGTITSGLTSIGNTKPLIDGIVSAVFWIAAVFKELPGIIDAVFEKFRSALEAFKTNWSSIGDFLLAGLGAVALVKGINFIAQAWRDMAAVMEGLDALFTSLDMLENPIIGAATIAAAAAAVGSAIWAYNKYVAPMFAGDGGSGTIQKNVDKIKADHDALMQQYNAGDQTGTGTADSAGPNGQSSQSVQSQQTEYLKQTAQNTKQLVDLRKYALGGGDLGRLGVTPVELSDYYRAGHAGGNSAARKLLEAIGEYVEDRVQGGIQSAIRQRVVS